MEFLRHCPQCGRRFHITLVGKKLDHLDRETVQTPPRVAPGALGHGYPVSLAVTPELVVEEGKPVTIDIEEFQYTYKCKHCGHEWYEKHAEKHVEKSEES
jgi:DNA-directed RNA polymerase subunit RPC12/RpoP